MGLFDDFTNFMNEAKSLKNEVTQLGSDVVKELAGEANGVKQTVADTTDAVKTAGQDVTTIIKDSTTLSSPKETTQLDEAGRQDSNDYAL